MDLNIKLWKEGRLNPEEVLEMFSEHLKNGLMEKDEAESEDIYLLKRTAEIIIKQGLISESGEILKRPELPPGADIPEIDRKRFQAVRQSPDIGLLRARYKGETRTFITIVQKGIDGSQLAYPLYLHLNDDEVKDISDIQGNPSLSEEEAKKYRNGEE